METKKTSKSLIAITVASTMMYILWRMFFTLPFDQNLVSIIAGIALLLCELISAFESFELMWLRYHSMEIELPEIPDSWFPDVDVFIATHNEPVDLLFKTVSACTYMEYPDKSKVHIYVSDDNNRPEVAKLAASLGVGYIGLSGNKHAKSGNLNNALSKTNSSLIATFDADMMPKRKFLMHSIPYFFLPKMKKDSNGKWVEREASEIDRNYKIGFIQTPQNFYNPDLFQYNLFSEKNMPNEQDFFTKGVNIARNHVNGVAYTGSNTVLSRQAVEDAGGFPTGTITEDFELGIRIQCKGYTTYASSEVLASGLTPTEIKDMLTQRIRWARGITQTMYNCKVPFNKNLTVGARIGYTASYSYWWSFLRRMVFILSPILFVLCGVQSVSCNLISLLLFWMPPYIIQNIAMKSISGNTRTQRWAQIIDSIMAPYMILPVLMEAFGIKMKKFKVTKKDTSAKGKPVTIHYAIPHIILLILSFWAIIKFTRGKYGTALLYGSVIIFWLTFNAVNLIFAVLFMLGRSRQRQNERFAAKEPLTIEFDGKIIKAVTEDVSEDGLCFKLERPYFIPDKPVLCTIQNQKYYSQFEARVLHVFQAGDNWRYSCKITSIDSENIRDYLQVVYDRMPTLPEKVNEWVSPFDNLTANISKRLEQQRSEMRSLPRIPFNMALPPISNAKGFIVDFNYRYICIRDFKPQKKCSRYEIALHNGIKFVIEPMPGFKSARDSDEQIFTVVNWEELVYNPHLEKLIDARLLVNKVIRKEQEEEKARYLLAIQD